MIPTDLLWISAGSIIVPDVCFLVLLDSCHTFEWGWFWRCCLDASYVDGDRSQRVQAVYISQGLCRRLPSMFGLYTWM